MTRDQLISRKHEVQHQLAQAQRRLEQARSQMERPKVVLSPSQPNAEQAAQTVMVIGWLRWLWQWILKGFTGPRAQQAKIAGLETRVASLMAEEHRLRLMIDQSR